MGSMREYAAFIAATRAPLADPANMYDLVRFATLAANGHNTQPWRFGIGTNQVLMIADVARRTPVVDPDDHHLYVSLGCALENLSIAGAARGFHAESDLHDAEQGCLAVNFEPGPRDNSPLFEAIPRRQSTRSVYDGRPVSESDLRLLLEAARVPGVDIVVVTERRVMEQLLELIIEANTAQIQDASFVRELKGWIRFNPRSAMQKGDGLFSAATGSPIVPTWLGTLFFGRFFRVDSENRKYVNQVRSSAGLAVFVSEREDKESWIRVGRSSQRFALQATALGVRHAFVNQPVEVPRFRAPLARIVGLANRRPDLVMRFGYGAALPYSPRRSAAAVVERVTAI